MGRAHNSFTSYVGHAEETISDDKVELPERSLWVAVLSRAALDACKGPPMLNMDLKCNRSHQNIYTYDRDQARHFFIDGGSHFRLICEMAGRNPDYVQQKVRKVLLRKEGWNVDVPVTSHYRQGSRRASARKRGKYKRKHLMGNAYYAAKAGKEMKKRNLYYSEMGSKGGRPRIYNV